MFIFDVITEGGANAGSCGKKPAAGAESASAPAGAASSDAHMDEQRDYLNHVGEQVSAMLEPLGVSVDVEVEERPANGKQRCGGKGKGQGGCFTKICAALGVNTTFIFTT